MQASGVLRVGLDALDELLLTLAAERRSGTLTVMTSRGAGEIRLVEGDVVDAVYVRLEGLKALFRLLSEREGTAAFVPGAPAVMRRIDGPTRGLVDDARAHASRAGELRARAGALTGGALLADDTGGGENESERQVLARLRAPTTLDDLLDELPSPDGAILASALSLHARGRIRAIRHDARVQLSGSDELHLARASAARAKAAGFSGPARLVFAATPARLSILGHAVRSLADAVAPPEGAPPVPVPHTLATIRLGDGVELDVTAVPLVPAYAPLWPMVLAGAAAVVRLDEAASQPLEEACGAVGVTIVDARAVLGVVDESSPVEVASLVRAALELGPAHG